MSPKKIAVKKSTLREPQVESREIAVKKSTPTEPQKTSELNLQAIAEENKENLPSTMSDAEKIFYVAHYEQKLADRRTSLLELAASLLTKKQ